MKNVLISQEIEGRLEYLSLPAAIDITKMPRPDIVAGLNMLIDELGIWPKEIGERAYQEPGRSTSQDVLDLLDDILTYSIGNSLARSWDKVYLFITVSKGGVVNVGVTRLPNGKSHEFSASIYSLSGFKKCYLAMQDRIPTRNPQ